MSLSSSSRLRPSSEAEGVASTRPHVFNSLLRYEKEWKLHARKGRFMVLLLLRAETSLKWKLNTLYSSIYKRVQL